MIFTNKKGFTLIELLVVIAIIAILAAILFPVFAQAREKARQTTCLSNMKQFGTATNLYVDDYDETYPLPRLHWYGYTTAKDLGMVTTDYPCWKWSTTDYKDPGMKYFWGDCLYPYIKNIKMYECPTMKDKLGYMMNENISSQADSTWAITVKTSSEISNTSNVILFMDAPFMGNQSNCIAATFSPWYLWNYAENNSSIWGWDQISIGVARHNKGANFTYCDGHAKFVKKGSSAPWNNGQDSNRDGWQ